MTLRGKPVRPEHRLAYWHDTGIIKGRWNDISQYAWIGEGSDIWCWNYIGKDVILGDRCHITNYVHIGERCRIGDDCNFQPHVYLTDDVEIGDRTIFAHGAGVNDIKYLTITRHPIREPVKIGSDVVIGSKVEIIGGATIGDRVVIGASALVTKDIPPDEVWLGVPARYYCSREEYDEKRLAYEQARKV